MEVKTHLFVTFQPLPSLEQIPFANEHAGTLRHKETLNSECINQDDENNDTDFKRSPCEETTEGKTKTKLNR